MGKRNSLRKKNDPIPVKIVVEKKSGLTKFWSRLSTAWKIIGGIGLLLGLFVSLTKLWDWIYPPKEIPVIEKTAKDKFIDKYLDTGTLRPPKLIADSAYSVLESPPVFTTPIMGDTLPIVKGLLLKNKEAQSISFLIGRTTLTIPKEKVSKGISLRLPFKSLNHADSISFGIRDNRVYVSVEFKDLLKQETVGWIDYNHWKVYSSNTLDYPKNDDSRLEVMDKQHNIVFSIKYTLGKDGSNWIFVNGYFIEPFHAISIIACNEDSSFKRIDTCILFGDSSWRREAYSLISSIKTIFP